MPKTPAGDADAAAPTPFDPSAYPSPDLESPQLTLRAVLAGCLFGGLLSLCDIYAGLKIGWGFDMRITAMLLAFGLFRPFRPLSMLENNVNQTAASAAASISSAGLVSAIPAFTILTGEKLGWGALACGEEELVERDPAPSGGAGAVAGKAGGSYTLANLGFALEPSVRMVGVGVIAGATIGSAGYLLLVPDPKAQLLTEQRPAPAVAAWKAVAELFREGFSAMPPRAMEAMGIAAALGVALAIAEKVLPKRARGFVPSPGSLGLAMVVPAVYSIAMFLGAMGAAAATRARPVWAAGFLIVLASGLIAGESIVGVGLAVWETVKGLAGG